MGEKAAFALPERACTIIL